MLNPIKCQKVFFEVCRYRGTRKTKIGRLSRIIAMYCFDEFLLKKVTMIFLVDLKDKFRCFELV